MRQRPKRRRLPPRRLQRAIVPARVPASAWRTGCRALLRGAAQLDEQLVLALDPCARICVCSDPGRHLRRRRRLPQVPSLPSGWALLDRGGVLLGVLDRRPRWRHPEQLRAVRSVLLLVLLLWAEIVAAALLFSYAEAHREELAQERLL